MLPLLAVRVLVPPVLPVGPSGQSGPSTAREMHSLLLSDDIGR